LFLTLLFTASIQKSKRNTTEELSSSRDNNTNREIERKLLALSYQGQMTNRVSRAGVEDKSHFHPSVVCVGFNTSSPAPLRPANVASGAAA
jgi:hypothetical protein